MKPMIKAFAIIATLTVLILGCAQKPTPWNIGEEVAPPKGCIEGVDC